LQLACVYSSLHGSFEQVTVVLTDPFPGTPVIHFVMTPEAGAAQIPAILRGEQNVETQSRLGTHDYSKKPVAVILGAGYDDAATEVMMKASKGIQPIPWLRPDLSKPTPPLGPEYGKALVNRIKELIPQLEKEGKANSEEVFFY
jgi:hypothetical protein